MSATTESTAGVECRQLATHLELRRNGASATVVNNTVSGFDYTPGDTEATGILLHQNEAGTFTASGNKLTANEVNLYGATGTRSGHVKP